MYQIKRSEEEREIIRKKTIVRKAELKRDILIEIFYLSGFRAGCLSKSILPKLLAMAFIWTLDRKITIMFSESNPTLHLIFSVGGVTPSILSPNDAQSASYPTSCIPTQRPTFQPKGIKLNRRPQIRIADLFFYLFAL